MIKEGITDKHEVQEICDIATEITGLINGSLSCKTRTEPYAIARQVVANICLNLGIHYETIAKVLNRHRTNIYHYEKKHDNNFKLWPPYRRTFTKVYNEYKERKGKQKVFINNQDLRSHLLNNNVETKKGEIFIVIKCGMCKTIINTSYISFSETLENIRLALIDYKYKLDVQL
tara:strand:+ start:998 stop:1519 length:522 start_codon:yes stop_codon:yes gene_type:complete